jgi:hypothetical protein
MTHQLLAFGFSSLECFLDCGHEDFLDERTSLRSLRYSEFGVADRE